MTRHRQAGRIKLTTALMLVGSVLVTLLVVLLSGGRGDCVDNKLLSCSGEPGLIIESAEKSSAGDQMFRSRFEPSDVLERENRHLETGEGSVSATVVDRYGLLEIVDVWIEMKASQDSGEVGSGPAGDGERLNVDQTQRLGRQYLSRVGHDRKFFVDGISPGLYEIRAFAGDVTLSGDQISVEGSSHCKVEIDLLGTGMLTGYIAGIGPDLAKLFVLRLRMSAALREVKSSADGRPPIEKYDFAGIRRDGFFRIGPVPAGKYILLGGFRSEQDCKSWAFLGEVSVFPGLDTEYSADFSLQVPGTIRVSLFLEDRPECPVEGATVRVKRIGPIRDAQSDEARQIATECQVKSDVRGKAEFGLVLPGRWEIGAWGSGSGWRMTDNKVVVLSPGGEVDVAIDVDMFKGAVVVAGKVSELALPDCHCLIRYPDGSIRNVKTDSTGGLELLLQPGSYQIYAYPGMDLFEVAKVHRGECDTYRDPEPVSFIWSVEGPSHAILIAEPLGMR